MKTNSYRIFITGNKNRFMDTLLEFQDIKPRIISNHTSGLFDRVVVELTNEELAVLKLSFDRYECTIMETLPHDKDGMLYDQLISAAMKHDM